MMFQTGDLVRIQSGFADPSGNEFDWIGMILSHRGAGGMMTSMRSMSCNGRIAHSQPMSTATTWR